MDRYPSMHERPPTADRRRRHRRRPPSACPSPSCRPPCCPARSSPSPSSPTSCAAPSRPPRAPATAALLLRAGPTAQLGRRRPGPRHRLAADRRARRHRPRRGPGPHRRRPHLRARRDLRRRRDPRATPARRRASRRSARELRGVLEQIAELRRSRRLPELLRSGARAGRARRRRRHAGPTSTRSRRREVLAAVDVGRARRAASSPGPATTSPSCRSPRRSATTSPRASTSSSASSCCASSWRRSARSSARATTTSSASTARSWRRSTSPDAAQNFIAKELDRLERTSAQSPEQGWIRTWLDRVFELPWGVRSDDTIDLAAAQAILDEDHYGLADVKSRIVEFLAVSKLRAERDIDEDAAERRGDPSAGRRARSSRSSGRQASARRSLGESIARAMGRKFVRVALGGIRDEAEIRGHRRTYVGSQPGRIVKAITEAGTMNPVVLLDEVDKLGAGAWSGDPTAALLEVLDPAQNHTFRDHYLELDLDLSEVVFIATANVLDTVPAPLLDRMDVVRLDGYTDDEKVFIARRYLLPRQLQRAGLGDDELTVDDDTDPRRHPRLHAGGRRALARARARPARPQGGGQDRRRRGAAGARRRAPRRLARPGEGRRRRARAHRAARRGHRPGRHRPRRRRAVHRDDGVPDGGRGRARPHAHRPARRRDEGVGADRPQLRALARRRARRRPRRGAPALPRPRARPAPCPRTARRPASR